MVELDTKLTHSIFFRSTVASIGSTLQDGLGEGVESYNTAKLCHLPSLASHQYWFFFLQYQQDDLGEGVVWYDTAKPCRPPSLDSRQYWLFSVQYLAGWSWRGCCVM